MARLPLTVYLARAELARIEARARALGMTRSALAGHAIRTLLDGGDGRDGALLEQLQFLRIATEELIAAHPRWEAIHDRMAAHLRGPDQPISKGDR